MYISVEGALHKKPKKSWIKELTTKLDWR